MDRRQFCRSAVAAGVTAAFLPACGKQAPDATQADTGIAAISLDGNEIQLEKAAIKELGDALYQEVRRRDRGCAFQRNSSVSGKKRLRPSLVLIQKNP